MAHSNLLDDPYYSSMIFQIENRIHHRDIQTGKVFRDSDVKSAIRKALTLLKGKQLKAAPKNEKEILVVNLARELVEFAGELTAIEEGKDDEGLKVPKSDFAKALLATEDSLKTRREIYSSSRGYLDYLIKFLAECKAA